MKGNFEGSSSKLASVASDFVEEQKNKDLLDVSIHYLPKRLGYLWRVIDATDSPIGHSYV